MRTIWKSQSAVARRPSSIAATSRPVSAYTSRNSGSPKSGRCEPGKPPMKPFVPTIPTCVPSTSPVVHARSSIFTPASSMTATTSSARSECQSWFPSTLKTGRSASCDASATTCASSGRPCVVRSPASSTRSAFPRRLVNAASRSARRDASACTSPAAATRMPMAITYPFRAGPSRGISAGMAEGSAPADQLVDVMMHVAAALRDADVPYLLAGSFAVWARGGPAHDTDLDFAVKPEDLERAIAALEAAGMEQKPTPEEWLKKVCDRDVQVDLIHDPAGLEIDDEVMERGDDIEVNGMTFRVMGVDDVMTTKLFAFKEHYLDYASTLEMARMMREQIDWDELRRRCLEYPYAKPFFTLAEELGLIEKPTGEVVSGEEVRAAQESRHGN